MARSALAAALTLLLFAPTARAADPVPVTGPPATPGLRASIEKARLDVPIDYRRHLPPHARGPALRRNIGLKIAAGALGGFGGMLGGAAIGAQFTKNCACDDPGLEGAIIGAPIGAIIGSITGVLLASR